MYNDCDVYLSEAFYTCKNKNIWSFWCVQWFVIKVCLCNGLAHGHAERMHHGHCLPSVQAINSVEHALRLQFFCSDVA
jgi:hypothetical protein